MVMLQEDKAYKVSLSEAHDAVIFVVINELLAEKACGEHHYNTVVFKVLHFKEKNIYKYTLKATFLLSNALVSNTSDSIMVYRTDLQYTIMGSQCSFEMVLYRRWTYLQTQNTSLES